MYLRNRVERCTQFVSFIFATFCRRRL